MNVVKKIKKTNIKRYDVECTLQCEKTKEILRDKYGTEFVLQNKEILGKTRKTQKELYGNEYFFGSNRYYEEKQGYEERSKITCKELYDDEIFVKSEKFKEMKQKSIIEKLKNIGIKLIEIDKDYNYIIECKNGHDFKIDAKTLYQRFFLYNTEICTICNPIGSYSSSGQELKLLDFIKENYDDEIITNSRNIISPKEIDIYLPKMKFSIEFDGLFWHNEITKDKNYHLNKTISCKEKEIELFHIFEDEWINKQDIVKSMLLNKIGKTKNKIFARKCIIKEIDDNDLIKNFLNENHIQGFVGSKIKIGLFFKDELVSLMSFGKNRIALGQKSLNNNYEMLRFCSKKYVSVIGSASKLFKYFLNKYKPNEIVSYSDRRYSDGNLYKFLGFTFIHHSKPNYFYVINGQRFHRFNFRKDVLVKDGYDSNKSEREIMMERKIYRIYDCGTSKFIYNN